MTITDILRNRLTTYRFLDQKIEDEKIIDLIDAARYAPNPTGIYEYEIIIVTDQKTKDEISKICLTPNIQTAPVMFIIICDESKIKNLFINNADEICIDNAALAAHSLVLKAEEMGIGNAMITNINQNEIKSLLNIPDKYIVRWVIPIGYPEEKNTYKTSPPKAGDIVHLEKF